MRQIVHLPVSWYEATAMRGAAWPALSGTRICDVCVVGAGFAGLTTALELANKGKSVIVLEASRVAAGASGRNGGFVSNGFALGIESVASQVGVEAAKSLHVLSRMGTAYVRDTIAAHDATIKMGDGMRVCVRHNDSGELAKHAQELSSVYGETVQHSRTPETRALLATPRYFDSLFFPNAFHIHPLRYGLLLAGLCEKAGAKIFEDTPALQVARDGSAWHISTQHGTVVARDVVHCVSSLDSRLHRLTGGATLPVATYVAVTEPLQQDVIRTTSAIADTRRAGDYYRLLGDGRILWGGRITTRLSEPARLAEEMKRDMLSTFPALGNPRIDYAWGGLMGYALHKMPLIGRDSEGQWFATAFGGHGLNTTAMAGVLLAQAIVDGDDSYRRFVPFAPRWAYGQLGRLGVQGSYWWMQARDRWDEARSR